LKYRSGTSLLGSTTVKHGILTVRWIQITAADIADHIADEMRKKLVCAVLDAKLPFSTLIDESTRLSQKSCLIVYLRCSVDNTCEPVCVFLDLLELDGTNADAIVASLMKCLHDNGFTDDILHDRWLGFASDGASVMLGRQTGVYARLSSMFPH